MSRRPPLRTAISALALLMLVVHCRVASAQSIGIVTVSPSVVPVSTNPNARSGLLVTASVSGVPSGATVACAVTLTLQSSGMVLSVSPPYSTSPAPASGVTSVSVPLSIAGGTAPGSAQASIVCGSSTGVAPFRISSVVALSVSPSSIPVGGVATVTVSIASGGPLPSPAQCTLIVTDPPGSLPLAVQVLSVSGGAATVPAAATTTVMVPPTTQPGPANASVSCVIQGVGTVGDSADFMIVPMSAVTILGLTNPVMAGGSLSLTAVTVPGFVCVARFAPPGGSRVDSAPATADQTGTVVLTVGVPATALSGSGSVIATCNDPTNAGNSASSPAQSVTVTGLQTSPSPSASPSPASSAGPSPGPPVPSPGAFAVSATLVGTPQPLAPGSLVTIAIVTMPGAGCSISSVVSSAGTSLAIAGSGASGVATLTGALTLTFDLPVTVIPGTEAALVTCSFNGTQGSARVTFQFDRSPGVANCDGGSAAAGLPSAAGSPVANPGSGYRGSAGEPVQFSGERSRPSSGAVLTSCLWNFGDGQTAATLNPSHTYAVEGAYSASLTITDSAGLSATAATPVNVSAYLPLCSQPALTGSAGLTACVTGLNCPATSLAGRCLPPCLTLPSTSLPVANGCPQPTRTVEIRINGPFLGQPSQPISLQATVRLTGTRRLCAADATLGVAGPICTIQPDNNLPAPVAYLWDFGDGQAGEGSQVSHAYSNPGEYPIELTLTFADDSTAKATSIARITAPTRKVSLTGGCTLLSLTFADGTRPATVAGAVSGGALSAIWLFSAAPPFKGWYPDTAAPQELSTLNRGDVVWLCTGGTATLTEPV